jgi:hypothetical protein
MAGRKIPPSSVRDPSTSVRRLRSARSSACNDSARGLGGRRSGTAGLSALAPSPPAPTRLDRFVDHGFLRTDYHDVEDFSVTHVVFEDGTVADIFASEIVMGGIHNWLEVMANNHRAICNINPNTSMQTY